MLDFSFTSPGGGSASPRVPHRSRAISAKVFIGNLNYSTTKEDLVAFLGEAGEIVDAFLPTDRETGRPRGFAFVTFATEDQAKACIEKFNRAELGGRALNINEAEDRPRRGPGGRPGGSRDRQPGGRSGGRPGGGFGGPRGAPPNPDEPTSDWNELRGGDWRGDDGGGRGGDDRGAWDNKKRKRGRGSRRGLRAKKRSL